MNTKDEQTTDKARRPVLTPNQVKAYPSALWVKDVPTKIRPLTQEDVERFGPFFLDLEQRKQPVAIGRFLCVGALGEQWTTSDASLERDREPISPPDAEGFRLYKMKHPAVLRCFDIPHAFALDVGVGRELWECHDVGGCYVTWNGVDGEGSVMRVIQRKAFEATYKPVQDKQAPS